MARNSLTIGFGLYLLMTSLEEFGYDMIETDDGYIWASDSSGKLSSIIALPLSRKLSNRKSPETFQVLASNDAVEKLIEKAQNVAGDFVPCIGFCISKYRYFDTECIVIPVTSWHGNQHPSLTIKTKGLYYNFSKFNSSLNCIVQTLWKGENQKL